MPISRRALLRSAGAGLLCAPFYRLLSRPAPARAATSAKRIIFWFSPNGTVHDFWRPTGANASFDFPAGSILEPLASHKSDLIVLDGLNFVGTRQGSHEGGMEHMLTGGGAPSIDQALAAQIGMATPFQSIELGVQTSDWGATIQTRMSYDDQHGYVQPEDDPVAAYHRLFGGASPAANGGGAGAAGAAGMGGAGGSAANSGSSAASLQKSVLDLVQGELTDLETQLGSLERQKLDAHLTAIRSIERRVGDVAVSGASCGGLAAPTLTDSKSNERFPDVGGLQMDILIAAAACDLSRVFSIQWSHTVSPTILSWAGAGEGHHELSHKDDSDTAGVASFVATERWFAAQFSLFLDKLKASPDPSGGGSLFDTSTVVWTKELGDSRLHDFNAVPFVVAGGGNGYWKLGQYLKFNAEPHQKLLVLLAQSMGVNIDHFGVSDVTGSLSGLST